jgi:hypothetical protein
METFMDATLFYEEVIAPNNADKSFVLPAWAISFAEKYADYKAANFYKLKLETELGEWENISKRILNKMDASPTQTPL